MIPSLVVITLVRRVLSESSVAANVLKHGTAGLNIEACRLQTEDNLNGGAYAGGVRPNSAMGCTGEAGGTGSMLEAGVERLDPGQYIQPPGRFPSNLILAHRPGCRRTGTKQVRSDGHFPADRGKGSLVSGPSGHSGQEGLVESYLDGEVVEVWDCAPGCPAPSIDQQSGVIRSDFNDEGGASRYFKQVQEGDEMTAVPDDLISYLQDLISPPDEPVEFWDGLAGRDLEAIKEGTLPGLILQATPTEDEAAALNRVLRPGAHLLLIAPDTEPTGHTGACRVEDAGMEIRDAILWVREEGRVHYVPKVSRSEREEGCGSLPPRTGAEAVDRQEGTDGLKSPRAGAGRTATQVCNHHPCLHPDALVMTEQGYRPILELGVGNRVYSADGQFHMVEHVSRHPYTSECLYEIFVKGTNYTTLASDNHPFLIWRPSRKGNHITGGEVLWLEAQEIRKGDYTMTPVLPDTPGESVDLRITRDVAKGSDLLELMFLFGLWVAEGVAHKAGHGSNVYPSFSLNVNETDLTGRIETFFRGRGINVGVYPKAEGASVQVVAFDPLVGEEFVRLGGTGASTKQLHPAVFAFPVDLREQILHGWLAGDGGQVRTWHQGKTVSPDLASQLRLLGEAAGFKTNLHWFEATPGEIQGRRFRETLPEYQLRFYGQDVTQTDRKPACPARLEHEGVEYRLCYVQAVEEIPYEGDVVNLTVQGSPTFQTAVGMSHNTVKPRNLMEALLSNVPKTKPVLDPFMGSGSTALACLRTGHDFEGIEREEEYLAIADARVRHHDRAFAGWIGAEIESEHIPKGDLSEPAEVELGVLFGWEE